MTYTEFVWSRFSKFYKDHDTNKDGDGRGTFERFMSCFGLELDNDVMPGVETFIDQLNPETAADQYLTLLSYCVGQPDDILDNITYYRRLLISIIALYQIKGTFRSYKMLFGLLGMTVGITEKFPTPNQYDTGKIYDDDVNITIYDDDPCTKVCVHYDLCYDNIPGNTIAPLSSDMQLKLRSMITSLIEPHSAILDNLTYTVGCGGTGPTVYEWRFQNRATTDWTLQGNLINPDQLVHVPMHPGDTGLTAVLDPGEEWGLGLTDDSASVPYYSAALMATQLAQLSYDILQAYIPIVNPGGTFVQFYMFSKSHIGNFIIKNTSTYQVVSVFDENGGSRQLGSAETYTVAKNAPGIIKITVSQVDTPIYALAHIELLVNNSLTQHNMPTTPDILYYQELANDVFNEDTTVEVQDTAYNLILKTNIPNQVDAFNSDNPYILTQYQGGFYDGISDDPSQRNRLFINNYSFQYRPIPIEPDNRTERVIMPWNLYNSQTHFALQPIIKDSNDKPKRDILNTYHVLVNGVEQAMNSFINPGGNLEAWSWGIAQPGDTNILDLIVGDNVVEILSYAFPILGAATLKICNRTSLAQTIGGHLLQPNENWYFPKYVGDETGITGNTIASTVNYQITDTAQVVSLTPLSNVDVQNYFGVYGNTEIQTQAIAQAGTWPEVDRLQKFITDDSPFLRFVNNTSIPLYYHWNTFTGSGNYEIIYPKDSIIMLPGDGRVIIDFRNQYPDYIGHQFNIFLDGVQVGTTITAGNEVIFLTIDISTPPSGPSYYEAIDA